MILPRFTAFLATLTIGVLAVQGKSKAVSPIDLYDSYVQESEALEKQGLVIMTFPDLSLETYDNFISEPLMIEGMNVYVFKHDFKTIITRGGIWTACHEAVKDAQGLLNNDTIYPYLTITMGFLQGWNEKTGRLAGTCQTSWFLKSTFKVGHYIGAYAGVDRTATMIKHLTDAGHNISIDTSDEAKDALKRLKAIRAKEIIENTKAAAAFYAKEGNKTKSEAGQGSKMSDPSASKADKKAKADNKEKTDKGSGSKHARRPLLLH